MTAVLKMIKTKILESKNIKVAIVDYGLGNLFSVKNACQHFGIDARITNSKQKISEAEAVILPGVGAFGDAIASLKQLYLFAFLKDIALSGKPFIGICLGMQLLMEESSEFGHTKGLGLIKGSVVPFSKPVDSSKRILKVPQVGWNRIFKVKDCSADPWKGSLLAGLKNGDFMYFVHSFYVVPKDSSVVFSKTIYGDVEFCSSLRYKNIFACQFHPERSGLVGLNIYKNILAFIKKSKGEKQHVNKT